MVRGIDNFFAGEDALTDTNKSYARLELGTRFTEGLGFIDDSSVKFKLNLPATQKRLRVIIESESEEDETLEEANRSSVLASRDTTDTSISAALRFISSEADLWKSRFDIGIKAKIPPDPFARYSAKRRWALNEAWSARFRQRFS